MHPTVRNLVLFGQLDASSELLFGLMQVQPSPARKTVLDTFVKTLKSAGIWQKLDLLYVLAAHDEQAARLNWIAPQTYQLVATNSPVFTTDRGYAGDGAAAHLVSGFNPSTAGGKFAQDSAHIGLWSRTDVTNANYDVGSTATRLASRSNFSNRPRGAVNNSVSITNSSVGTTTSLGHFCLNRASAAEVAYYQGGAAVGTPQALTSAALQNANLDILRANTSYTTRELAAVHVGASLSAGDVAGLNTALTACLTAVGAA